MVLTLSLSVLYGRLPCQTLTEWSSITEVESVYRAVRTEPLYKIEKFRFLSHLYRAS